MTYLPSSLIFKTPLLLKLLLKKKLLYYGYRTQSANECHWVPLGGIAWNVGLAIGV